MKILPPRKSNGRFASPKELFKEKKTIFLLEEHPYSTEKLGACTKEQAFQYMKDWGGHFIEV